jgi:hypothetical protein
MILVGDELLGVDEKTQTGSLKHPKTEEFRLQNWEA